MNKLLHVGITMTGLWLGLISSAIALPGQTIDEAAAWMQAHPSLRARPSERLSIRRNNTPSQRYTFHGSVFGPSGGSGESLLLRQHSGETIMVHSERFTLVDIVRGVNIPQLEDSLRSLYGAEVYADYRRAQTVIVYSPDRPEERGSAIASRSHLLEGDLYGYLIELMPDDSGQLQTGAVTVMLREDIPAIQEGLQEREISRREFETPESRRVIHNNGVSLERILEGIEN
ncbi:MAG: hypothetical protein AAFU53_12270 [Cyanobacteria bacterium J06632_3]